MDRDEIKICTGKHKPLNHLIILDDKKIYIYCEACTERVYEIPLEELKV